MTLHDKLAEAHPRLARGIVWCTKCGREQRAKASNALAHGWPKCCGYTMTIDSPNEREVQRDA